jgi:hypothetical protein
MDLGSARRAWQSKLRNRNVRERFQSALDRWGKKVAPVIEKGRESERLDEHDLAVRVNTRG